MVGRDLNALVNCDVVHNLCPPPDPKLFPEGAGDRLDQARPGRLEVPRRRPRHASTDMKEFSRAGRRAGLRVPRHRRVLVALERRADQGAGGVLATSAASASGSGGTPRLCARPRPARTFFSRAATLGVVGAKIDFFDHEHREVVDLYPALLREAAKHRIMVNFHGANKPTGEPRTWPNELIREGVRGMESSRLRAGAAQHDAAVHALPGRPRATTRRCISASAAATRPGRTRSPPPPCSPSRCSPTARTRRRCWQTPRVDDQEHPGRVGRDDRVAASEIGEVAAFARRSGDAWFLAVAERPERAERLTCRCRFLARANTVHRSFATARTTRPRSRLRRTQDDGRRHADDRAKRRRRRALGSVSRPAC